MIRRQTHRIRFSAISTKDMSVNCLTNAKCRNENHIAKDIINQQKMPISMLNSSTTVNT